MFTAEKCKIVIFSQQIIYTFILMYQDYERIWGTEYIPTTAIIMPNERNQQVGFSLSYVNGKYFFQGVGWELGDIGL